ncbi:MAG: FHA domain-containing protein, partial [Planctomycetota bacterium]|nr:FHA domain-containing protein [Planctomycetota bacterium]
MRYIVVRKQNTEALKQFKILAPVITIGRTSENSIALKDNTVSRQHCAIETSKGVTRIRDLGSFHGFLINDKQSREAVLKHGDRIILGTFELFYVIKEDEPDPLSEGGVTQNRPPPAAPEAEPVSNGEAAEAPEDEAASPMEGEFVTEQDIPDASQPPEQSPEQSPEQPEAPDQYRSPLHNVIKSTQTLNDDSDLGIEMQTGDFPLPATPSDDVEDDASQDDDLDLNAILEDEEDSPKAPAPPSSRPPATKNAPPKTNVPSASNGSTDQSMAEADAHIKQLQIEFGDLLKRFESNKVQLSKSIEGLEAEKLKSDTAIRKYKRALEKIGAQENELIETRESIKGLESDATQSLKEY